MNYIIGLDAHVSHCDFAVFKGSKNLVEYKQISTSEECLIDYIMKFKGSKVLIFEEGTLSQWLYEIFLPYFDDIIIANPYENYLIHKGDQKCDKIDSRKLVKLYVNNSIKRVYHTKGEIKNLKRIVLQYHSFVGEQVRLKNRINAKFREQGIFLKKGTGSARSYKCYLDDNIRNPASKIIINSLIELLEEVGKKKDLFLQLMKEQSKKHTIIKRFKKLPGVGDITAITFFALIMTPNRFKTKRKLWSYCKLGISTIRSGDRIYSQGLTRKGIALLKYVAVLAANTNINRTNSCFKRMYLRLVENGLSPKVAKITIARKIVSTMYYMWLKGFTFSEKHIT